MIFYGYVKVYLAGLSGIGVYIGNASLAGQVGPRVAEKDFRSDSLRSQHLSAWGLTKLPLVGKNYTVNIVGNILLILMVNKDGYYLVNNG